MTENEFSPQAYGVFVSDSNKGTYTDSTILLTGDISNDAGVTVTNSAVYTSVGAAKVAPQSA